MTPAQIAHMATMRNSNNPALWAVANGLVSSSSMPPNPVSPAQIQPSTRAVTFTGDAVLVKANQARLIAIQTTLKKINWKKIERAIHIAANISRIIAFIESFSK